MRAIHTFGRKMHGMVAGGHHFMETPPGDYVIAYKLPAGANER